MVVTNKDQVSITEISHVQKKVNFFHFFLSFIFPVIPSLFLGKILTKKIKPILPFNGKFIVDAENGVVF